MALSIDVHWLNPLCWVGPVLDKELRVLSRRKRTYWIKGLFPVCLVLMVLSAWLGAGRGGNISAAGLEGLTRISRSVVSSMTWLQFVLCQCMAVVMLSHAMHDEIRRRTLDVLMTTPVRSLQIILGKLLGQLMTVWVVLSLSLPVLAIIRVWGGVSWDFLVATWCVTVCATLCAASFSLFVALWIRRAHQAILVVLSLIVLSYMVGVFGSFLSGISWRWLSLISPFTVFLSLNANFNAASRSASPGLWMPLCSVMLGLSLFFVLLSVLMLRRRILHTIHGTNRDRRFHKLATHLFLGRKRRQDRPMRSVTGAPVLWKELGCGPWTCLRRQWPWMILLSLGAVVCHLALPPMYSQLPMAAIWYVVMLRVSVMAALCVAQEKEARSWTVLLGTPVPDIWLLRHKAIAVLMKNGSGLVALLVYYASGLLIPQRNAFGGLLNLAVIFSFIGMLYMVTGVGLYASVRMKTGAMAIIATLVAWVFWQLISRVLITLIVVSMGVFSGGGGPSLLWVYYLIMPILSIVVGAVMLKLAGRNLRTYAF